MIVFPYQFSVQSKEWIVFMRNIIPFLHSAVIFIIHNRMTMGSLICSWSLPNSFPRRSKGMYASYPRAKNRAGPFISIGDFPLPRENKWEFIRTLCAAPSILVFSFERDFIMLFTLQKISTLSAVEYSGVYGSITNPDNDLPTVMDALCET